MPPITGAPFQKLTLVESLACPVLRQSRPRLLLRHHHRLRSSSSPQSIWSVMLFPGIHGRRADRYATSKMSSSPCQSPIRSLSLSLVIIVTTTTETFGEAWILFERAARAIRNGGGKIAIKSLLFFLRNVSFQRSSNVLLTRGVLF